MVTRFSRLASMRTFCASNFGTLVHGRNPTKLRFDVLKVKFGYVITLPYTISTFHFQVLYPEIALEKLFKKQGPHRMSM